MNVVSVIERDLVATGLPYSIDPGTNHLKIKLAGRLVGILPRKGKAADKDRRPTRNVRAQIRRAARELRERG